MNPQFASGGMPEQALPSLETLQKIAAKRQIRKTANRVGVAFLIMNAIMTLWSLPVFAIVRAVGGNPKEVYSFLSGEVFGNVLQIAVSSLAFLLSFRLLAAMQRKRCSDLISFSRCSQKGLPAPLFLIGLGVCGFANIATVIAGNIFESLGFQYTVSGMDSTAHNPYGIVLSILATAITPALVEEFAMRGMVFGSFRPYGEKLAVLASATLFSLMHGNFEQIPFTFLMGLYLSYVTAKTGSVRLAILLHAANNGFSLLNDYLCEGLSRRAVQAMSYGYLILLTGCLFFGVLLLKKWGVEDLNLKKTPGPLTDGQQTGVFFSSPVILISIAVIGIRAVGLF